MLVITIRSINRLVLTVEVNCILSEGQTEFCSNIIQTDISLQRLPWQEQSRSVKSCQKLLSSCNSVVPYLVHQLLTVYQHEQFLHYSV